MSTWTDPAPMWWSRMAMLVRCRHCPCRRGITPAGVLVCPRCDFAHEGASGIPNENTIMDAPKDWA